MKFRPKFANSMWRIGIEQRSGKDSDTPIYSREPLSIQFFDIGNGRDKRCTVGREAATRLNNHFDVLLGAFAQPPCVFTYGIAERTYVKTGTMVLIVYP